MHDFIIVGAGTAGCVLAERLTASSAHRVLLIEAGTKPDSLFVRVPLGIAKLFRTHLDWNLESGGERRPDFRQSAGRPSMATDGPRVMPGTRCESWDWKWWPGSERTNDTRIVSNTESDAGDRLCPHGMSSTPHQPRRRFRGPSARATRGIVDPYR